MKDEVTGVVGGVIVALIHQGAFKDIKSKSELREEISKAITSVGEDFSK